MSSKQKQIKVAQMKEGIEFAICEINRPKPKSYGVGAITVSVTLFMQMVDYIEKLEGELNEHTRRNTSKSNIEKCTRKI